MKFILANIGRLRHILPIIGLASLTVSPVLFMTEPLESQEVPSEIRAVVAKMNSLTSFRATVQIGQGNGLASGQLSYQGGKVHLQMSDGRVVAGNGRSMVVYSPASRTAGKQPMAGGGGGLGWILSGYEWRVGSGNASGQAINSNATNQEVRIVWGRDYILRRLSVKRKDSDSWFTIALSNVRPVGGFPAGLFSYSPPAGSRTVENPLNERN